MILKLKCLFYQSKYISFHLILYSYSNFDSNKSKKGLIEKNTLYACREFYFEKECGKKISEFFGYLYDLVLLEILFFQKIILITILISLDLKVFFWVVVWNKNMIQIILNQETNLSPTGKRTKLENLRTRNIENFGKQNIKPF